MHAVSTHDMNPKRAIYLMLSCAHHLGFLLNTHATLSTSLSWLKAQHIGAEALGLSELETNLGIGVQAKCQGRLRGHCFINVFQHLKKQTSSAWQAGDQCYSSNVQKFSVKCMF